MKAKLIIQLAIVASKRYYELLLVDNYSKVNSEPIDESEEQLAELMSILTP